MADRPCPFPRYHWLCISRRCEIVSINGDTMGSKESLVCPVCGQASLDLKELQSEGYVECSTCGAKLEVHGENPWHILHYEKPLHRYSIYLGQEVNNLLPDGELEFFCHAEYIDGSDDEPIEAMADALQGLKDRLTALYDEAVSAGHIEWQDVEDDGITEYVLQENEWNVIESKRCNVCNERLAKLPYGWENGKRIPIGNPGIWQCRVHGFGEKPQDG